MPIFLALSMAVPCSPVLSGPTFPKGQYRYCCLTLVWGGSFWRSTSIGSALFTHRREMYTHRECQHNGKMLRRPVGVQSAFS